MSFPFRNKPSLRDRLRGKSGDEILKALRQELNEDGKMFFDNPNWGSSPASSTFSRKFPTEDVGDMMRGGGGGRNLNEQLDKIVERHPELAEELKEWRRGGEELGERERLRKTVPDMSSQREERGHRARSAPPQHYTPPTRVNSQDEMRSHQQEQHQFPHQQQQNHQQSGSQAAPARVWHIPIFVEGRDELLLPKEAQEERASVPQHQGPIPAPPPQVPIPAPPPQGPIPAPAPQQGPIPAPAPPQQGPIPAPAPPQQGPIPAPAPPQQGPIPSPASQPQGPIPAPPPQQTIHAPSSQHISSQSPPTSGNWDPQEPIPAPPPPPHVQPPPDHNCEEPPPPDVTEPIKDRAIETITKVEEEVASLKERVAAWKGGSKRDKEYIFLDEMLTRNLLKLDDVDTEGREEVRSRRRHVIQVVQQCISSLDVKTEPS